MESKPGVHTTEFWAMVAAVVLPWLATLGQNADVVSLVPEKYRWVLPVVASLATALATSGYAVGRGKAKQGVAYEGQP